MRNNISEILDIASNIEWYSPERKLILENKRKNNKDINLMSANEISKSLGLDIDYKSNIKKISIDEFRQKLIDGNIPINEFQYIFDLYDKLNTPNKNDMKKEIIKSHADFVRNRQLLKQETQQQNGNPFTSFIEKYDFPETAVTKIDYLTIEEKLIADKFIDLLNKKVKPIDAMKQSGISKELLTKIREYIKIKQIKKALLSDISKGRKASPIGTESGKYIKTTNGWKLKKETQGKDNKENFIDSYLNKIDKFDSLDNLKELEKEFESKLNEMDLPKEKKVEFYNNFFRKFDRKQSEIRDKIKNEIATKLSGKTLTFEQIKNIVGGKLNVNSIFNIFSPNEVKIGEDTYKLQFKYQPYNSYMYVLQDNKANRKQGYNGKMYQQMKQELNNLISGEKLSYAKPEITFGDLIKKSLLADISKGKKAEPIGAISKDGKRKKVKNGEWVEIKKENKLETNNTIDKPLMVRNTIISPKVFNELPQENKEKIKDLYNEFKTIHYIDATLVLPDQWSRTSKNQKEKMQNDRIRVFKIESEIKELLKPKKQVEKEQNEKQDKEIQSKIEYFKRNIKQIEDLGRMSHKENGKLKPKYQKTVDIYMNELNKLQKSIEITPSLNGNLAPQGSIDSQKPEVMSKIKVSLQPDIIKKAKKDMKKQNKIHKVMTEFKNGTLKDSAGNIVTDRKQAIAIAINESEQLNKSVDKKQIPDLKSHLNEINSLLNKNEGIDKKELIKQIILGFNIEKEHNEDNKETIKIVFDHLNENIMYYTEKKPENWAAKELNEVKKALLADITKGKKAEPIGAISKDGKRKKVKNGEWVEVKKKKEEPKNTKVDKVFNNELDHLLWLKTNNPRTLSNHELLCKLLGKSVTYEHWELPSDPKHSWVVFSLLNPQIAAITVKKLNKLGLDAKKYTAIDSKTIILRNDNNIFEKIFNFNEVNKSIKKSFYGGYDFQAVSKKVKGITIINLINDRLEWLNECATQCILNLSIIQAKLQALNLMPNESNYFTFEQMESNKPNNKLMAMYNRLINSPENFKDEINYYKDLREMYETDKTYEVNMAQIKTLKNREKPFERIDFGIGESPVTEN